MSISNKRKPEFIDVDNLIYDMKRQPARVRHDGDLVGDCEYLLDVAESKHKIKEAEISKKYRRKFLKRGEKVTEVYIKELVTTHPDVIKTQEDFIEAKRKVASAKSKFKATISKGEMLINIGFMVRKEIDQGTYNDKKKKALRKGELKTGGVFNGEEE